MKISNMSFSLLLSFSVVLFFEQKVFAQLPNIPLCAVGTDLDKPVHVIQPSSHKKSQEPVVLKQASQDKIHVIDIAFIYPSSLSNRAKLLQRVRTAVLKANVIFARSNVNARLRTVAVQPDRKYNISLEKVGVYPAERLMIDILSDVRSDYGADLLYALTNKEKPRACGVAQYRRKNEDSKIAARYAATGAIFYGDDNSKISCLDYNYVLAHEVGHNLGLQHDIEDNKLSPYTPFVPYGRGYKNKNINNRSYTTVMGVFSFARFDRFSSDSSHEGLKMGSSAANASKALLYTIEDASNYAETKVKDPVLEYQCLESEHNVCLQGARFHVEAQVFYKNSSGNQVNQKAKVKKAMLNGVNKTSSLFYFFSESNPELLVKVIDGCGVNGKYWVFGSAGTDLDYSVFVTDNATGVRIPYHRGSTNPLINDASAFSCTVSR